MNKKIYLFKIKSLLIIILTITITTVSFNSQYAYASAKTKAVQAFLDAAFETTVKETGYKFATQAEIDAMRATFKRELPFQEVTFCPRITQTDIDNAPDNFKSALQWQKDIQVNSDVELVNINQSFRDAINRTIATFDTKSITTDSITDRTVIKVGDTYTSTNLTTRLEFVFSGDTTGSSFYNITPGTSWEMYFVDLMQGGVFIRDELFQFYLNGQKVGDPHYVGTRGSWTAFTSPSVDVSVIQYNSNGTKINVVNKIDTGVTNKSDYTPYPSTSADVTSDTKIPTVIAIPTTTVVDPTTGDEVITPVVTPSTFPTTKVPPVDGTAQVDDQTVLFTSPVIDPNTGQIIDPIVIPITPPITDPTTPPITDPTVPPGDVPKLDFTPLQVATRKFPFCIPWDIYDTVKLLSADAESPKFTIHEVRFTSSSLGIDIAVIPNYEWDLSTYPNVNQFLAIFRWFEVLCFLFFLYLNTRDKFIRG